MTSATTPLDTFAAAYRLRITRDEYNERIIPGKRGSLITEYGDGRLSVLLMGISARWWNGRRTALVAAGARLEQDGDTEGSLSFDPANVTASALAIKAAGCRQRRRQSATQLANLRSDAGEKTRFQAAKTDDRSPGIAGALPRGSLRVLRPASDSSRPHGPRRPTGARHLCAALRSLLPLP